MEENENGVIFCWNQGFDFRKYDAVRLYSLSVMPVIPKKQDSIITVRSNLIQRTSTNPERELYVVSLRKAKEYIYIPSVYGRTLI